MRNGCQKQSIQLHLPFPPSLLPSSLFPPSSFSYDNNDSTNEKITFIKHNYWILTRYLVLGAEVVNPFNNTMKYFLLWFSTKGSENWDLAIANVKPHFWFYYHFLLGNTNCRSSLVNVTVKYRGCQKKLEMARCVGECKNTVRWVFLWMCTVH